MDGFVAVVFLIPTEFTSVWLSNLGLVEHRNKILYISNINLKPSVLRLDRANWCDHIISPIATPLSDGLRFENSLCFWWCCMGIQMATESQTYMNYRLYFFLLTAYSLWFGDWMFRGSWFYIIHSVHWDIFLSKVKCWYLWNIYNYTLYFLPHISYFLQSTAIFRE